MPLNKNNFLRWNGVFKPRAFTILGSGSSPINFFATDDFITLNPFTSCSCSASNSILDTSFRVLAIKDLLTGNDIDMSAPCEWDSNTQTLTVFRPLDLSLTFIEVIFSFGDQAGNTLDGFDNTLGTQVNCVNISMSTVSTTWVVYPVSATCVIDSFGGNTGYTAWSQLELVNMATSIPVSPLTLKPNDISDPDYQAPVQDYISCPPAGIGGYASLIVSNFSKNPTDPTNFITITNIFLASSNMGVGATPLSLNIPCNIPPGQTVRFNVPASSLGLTYDLGLTITYLVSGNMLTASPLRYWFKNISGIVDGFPTPGLGSNPVINAGVQSSGGSFDVPTQGVTIYAQ